MKKQSIKYIEELIKRYPKLSDCFNQIINALDLLIESYKKHGKLLICGNGGSSADSDHIVGELMKGFVLPRRLNPSLCEKIKKNSSNSDYLCSHLQMGLPAISLSSHNALNTAFSNDCAPDLAFAQQVLNYGNENDAFLGISTSGNSRNVVYAAEIAKTLGLVSIALTGLKESKLSSICDVTIRVPETETYKIQELHLPVYHAMCLALEEEFFGNESIDN